MSRHAGTDLAGFEAAAPVLAVVNPGAFGNYRQRIAETDMEPLPQTLCDLIEGVIQRARLWPSEKRDVPAELESHFHEGLAELAQENTPQEQAAEMLQACFGDPKLAAKLIRRGKKQGRAMIWKLFVRTMCVLVRLLGSTGAYAGWLLCGRPSPSVDYLARINEPIRQVHSKDCVWPLLRDILLELEPWPETLDAVDLPHPGEPEWNVAFDWLGAKRHLMPMLKRAVAKPFFGLTYENTKSRKCMHDLMIRCSKADENTPFVSSVNEPYPPVVSALLPHLQPLRHAAKFRVLDSREHLSRSKCDSAWTSLDIGYRIGLHLSQASSVVEQSVGAAIVRLVSQEMRIALYRMQNELPGNWQEVVLHSQFMFVDNHQAKVDFTDRRLMCEDIVQYAFTDNGCGNGHLIPTEYLLITRDLFDDSYYCQPEIKIDRVIQALDLLQRTAVHASRKATMAKYEELWGTVTERLALPLYDPR